MLLSLAGWGGGSGVGKSRERFWILVRIGGEVIRLRLRIGTSMDVGLSGSGSGSKLRESRVIGAYLSFTTRLTVSSRLTVIVSVAAHTTRTRSGEQIFPSTSKQCLDSFSGSFFFQCSVFINFDGVQRNLNFRSSVGGNCLSLRWYKNRGIAAWNNWKVGDGDSFSFILFLRTVFVLVQSYSTIS